MSYSDVLEGLHERFALVVETDLNLIIGEPTAIHQVPALYSVLESFDRSYDGELVRVRYRTLHRLCIRWQDNLAAEEELAELVNAIPAMVEADPRLGKRLKARGDSKIVAGDAGWTTIGGTEYRSLDFHSEVWEVGALGQL
jgi:hypothetical protein